MPPLKHRDPLERAQRAARVAQEVRGEIARVLRTAREEQSITQRSLAAKADIDYTYVSKIENGIQSPSVESLIRLAEALGLSRREIDELLILMGRVPDDLSLAQRRRLAMYIPEGQHRS